jgi:hypothetical protein
MRNVWSLSRVLLLLIPAVTLLIGCEERESFFIDDDEEIRRYLSTTEEGRELFRTEGLVPDHPYAAGSAVHQDSIVYFERVITIDRVRADTLTSEFRAFSGRARHAELTVEDFWEVQLTKIGPEPEDTAVTFQNRYMTRHALFVKVGDDTRPYAGWRMWGFNGGYPLAPADITITDESGKSFQGDPTTYSRQEYYLVNLAVSPPDYVRNSSGTPVRYLTAQAYLPLTDIAAVGDGDSLQINGDFLTNLDRYQLVAWESDTGFVVQALTVFPLEDRFFGVVHTRSNTPHRYNILYLQQIRYSFATPEIVTHQGWCAPFRIEQ